MNMMHETIKTAKLSHKNKVSDSIAKFSNIEIGGYVNANNNTIAGYGAYTYDTFIWSKEILEDFEVIIWKETIKKEMSLGKNIYNMARLYRIDDFSELRDYAKKYNIKYFDCSNPNKFQELEKYAKIDNSSSYPNLIITVMGTGMRSGKFTTSMILRDELTKYFNVGIVGTEPQSMLCGIDEMVIPQLIPLYNVAPAIWGAIKKVNLENKNIDVIMISSQTGIYSNPLDIGTGRGGGVVSLAILLGSKPDYIILASHTLNIGEIKKNIETIELLGGKKVIGITINSKNIDLEYGELKNKLNDISDKLNIPVAELVKKINFEEFIKNIVELIQNNKNITYSKSQKD